MDKYSLTKASALFKEKYIKKTANLYNSKNVILMRRKIHGNFTSKKGHITATLSFGGSVGSGSLPYAGVAKYEDATIETKKVYGRAAIDRESVAAAINDSGAFVRLTKEPIKKTVESYLRNESRILFSDGSGKLGEDDGATAITGLGTAASPFVVVMALSNWKEANWEEQDFVHSGTDSGKTTLLQIYEVDPDTRTIKFIYTDAGTSSTLAAGAATGGSFYMQNSKDSDPKGLYGIARLTDAEYVASGTLYGITVQRRWRMHTIDAAGVAVNTPIMNKMVLRIEKRVGVNVDMIAASYTQYEKFLNLYEDFKRFTIEPRYIKGKKLRIKASFNAIAFASTKGDIPVVTERFVEDDSMYFLNMNFIEVYRRPKFGWFDDDGTVFMRIADEDSYEARYGGYYQNFITPTYHGLIYGLSVA